MRVYGMHLLFLTPNLHSQRAIWHVSVVGPSLKFCTTEHLNLSHLPTQYNVFSRVLSMSACGAFMSWTVGSNLKFVGVLAEIRPKHVEEAIAPAMLDRLHEQVTLPSFSFVSICTSFGHGRAERESLIKHRSAHDTWPPAGVLYRGCTR